MRFLVVLYNISLFQIYDGNAFVEELRGTKSNYTYTSHGSQIELEFESDDDLNFPGFEASFKRKKRLLLVQTKVVTGLCQREKFIQNS